MLGGDQLGTIRFDSWLSYQRNTDGSGLFPTVTFALPDGWSLAFYPENGITYNAVTHKWFVPIDLMVVKRLTNGVDLGIGSAYPLAKEDRLYKYNIYGRATFYF